MIQLFLARSFAFFQGKKKKKPVARPDLDADLKVALLECARTKWRPQSVARVADLYGALGLPFKAIESLNQIPFEMKTADTWLRLAVAYSSAGEMAACAENIERSIPELLTEGQVTRYHLLKCQLFAECGDFDGMLDHLERHYTKLPFELEVQRLEALSSLGRDDEASIGYHRLMANPLIKTGIAKAAINHFHRVNDHSSALSLTREAQRRWPKDLSLQVTLCRTYWSLGQMPKFVEAVKQAFGYKAMITDPVVSHAFKAAKLDPSVTELLDAAMARIQTKTKNDASFSTLKLAHTACQAGRHDIATDIADRYLQGGGIAPLARYILALCKLADGKHRAAMNDLEAVLAEAPYLDAAYHHLYSAAATSENTADEIVEIVASKRTKVPRFRLVDPYGRRIHQNPDLIALQYVHGEFEAGLREKVDRRALHALSYFSPENRPFREVDLRGGKSLFLIADDGVSDEVRWAQHLHRFSRRFDHVEATCEPRLLRIMERSFPHIKFHPVHRIWGESPKRFTDPRQDIPNWEIAHYLDGENLRRLKAFDKVAFTNEMVLALVKERGTLVTEQVPGGYLLPDTGQKRLWAEKISRIAAGRKRVGILWRSSVVDRKRRRFYFELESLRPLLEMADCALFSLQHAAKPEEIEWCRKNGINVLDVDLFEDFEGIAAIASEMNVVIGPSTLPTEMAAAVGTPVILPGVNFETVGIRLHKGAGAACRHTKNAFVACDPDGYSDPEADQVDRLNRLMLLIAGEIGTGRYGAGLRGY